MCTWDRGRRVCRAVNVTTPLRSGAANSDEEQEEAGSIGLRTPSTHCDPSYEACTPTGSNTGRLCRPEQLLPLEGPTRRCHCSFARAAGALRRGRWRSLFSDLLSSAARLAAAPVERVVFLGATSRAAMLQPAVARRPHLPSPNFVLSLADSLHPCRTFRSFLRCRVISSMVCFSPFFFFFLRSTRAKITSLRFCKSHVLSHSVLADQA